MSDDTLKVAIVFAWLIFLVLLAGYRSGEEGKG